MSNHPTTEIFFSGNSFRESLGNGLFQVIFYSFKGRSVTLVCINKLSLSERKLFIQQARSFNISLSFKFETRYSKTNSVAITIARFVARLGLPVIWVTSLVGIFWGLFFFLATSGLNSTRFFGAKSGTPLVVLSPMDLHKLPPKLMLKRRKVVIVADLLFKDFPEQFNKKEVDAFVRSTRRLLRFVDEIVCFSKHVKERHLIPVLGLDEKSIRVIPHVKHDLAPLLDSSPLIKGSGLETARSIIKKSKKFTKKQKKRLLIGQYIISCSTYRKPYKGFATLKTISGLLKNVRTEKDDQLLIHLANTYGHGLEKKSRKERIEWSIENIQKISSAVDNFGSSAFWETADDAYQFLAACQEWVDHRKSRDNFFILATNVPHESKQEFLKDKNIVPEDKLDAVELAAVYKVAAGAIHCSHFEGGINVAPFTEAVSLGVPCIFQKCLATVEAGLTPLLGEFDVNEKGSLEIAINRLLEDGEELFGLQSSYFSEIKYDEKQKLAKWDQLIRQKHKL